MERVRLEHKQRRWICAFQFSCCSETSRMRSLWNRLHGIQKPAAFCIALVLFFFLLSYLGEYETRTFLKTAKSAAGRFSGHAVDIHREDREKGTRTDTQTYRARVVFKMPEGAEHSFEGREQ